MARISTHVLDITRGTPAHGIAVELHFVKGAERRLIAAVTTNADGRTDAPLISGDRLETGIYELTFHAADYFHRLGVTLSDPPFLGVIVVRIGIASSAGNYHVPLLSRPTATAPTAGHDVHRAGPRSDSPVPAAGTTFRNARRDDAAVSLEADARRAHRAGSVDVAHRDDRARRRGRQPSRRLRRSTAAGPSRRPTPLHRLASRHRAQCRRIRRRARRRAGRRARRDAGESAIAVQHRSGRIFRRGRRALRRAVSSAAARWPGRSTRRCSTDETRPAARCGKRFAASASIPTAFPTRRRRPMRSATSSFTSSRDRCSTA